MPIYKYYEILPDGSEGESEPFDVSQKINGPTLEVNTITGSPIKSIFPQPQLILNTLIKRQKTIGPLNPSATRLHSIHKG